MPHRFPASGRPGRSASEPPPGHPEDDLGDPEQVARQICLRLLADRARTRAELADALRKRGVPDAAAAAVLDRFTEVGLIDDTAFAQAWVESRQRGRGLARRALAAELRRKGVDADAAEQALDSVDPAAEQSAAVALVRKRLRTMTGLAPDVAARRLLGMLARKGYSGELATAVVRAELTDLEPETSL